MLLYGAHRVLLLAEPCLEVGVGFLELLDLDGVGPLSGAGVEEPPAVDALEQPEPVLAPELAPPVVGSET